MNKKAINVSISFDYELAWGVWDTRPLAYITSNVSNANEAARRIIDLHKQYDIPSTWALVGLLLKNDAEPSLLLANICSHKKKDNISDIKAFFENGHHRLFFADADIISALSSGKFEIASHTFSHIYTLDATDMELSKDFADFTDIMRERGLGKPLSIIFPKNQVTDTSIDMAKKAGYRCIRVNPDNLLYRTERHKNLRRNFIKLLRYLDSFLPINELFFWGGKPKQEQKNIHISVGNIFFRPNSGNAVLDFMHYIRVVLGLNYCKLTCRNFHIWTHPHNFGGNIEQSILNYERILSYLLKEKKRQKIQFKNMRDFAENI